MCISVCVCVCVFFFNEYNFTVHQIDTNTHIHTHERRERESPSGSLQRCVVCACARNISNNNVTQTRSLALLLRTLRNTRRCDGGAVKRLTLQLRNGVVREKEEHF